MEKLKRIIQGLPANSFTEQVIVNTTREYLQVLLLKMIYQSSFGSALSFMGGTSLRICYDLKRYSEDLDFALDDKPRSYKFSSLIQTLKRELELQGFEVSENFHEEKIVQKAFLSFSGLSQALELKSFGKDQKIHIKLEVDTKPTPLKKGERESFFVTRFQEIFPILKHTLPTLFAGKILAIFLRPYARGRDYYDLIWYLTRKTGLNLSFLNRGLKEQSFKTREEVFKALRKKIQEVDPALILKDISRFLEDPTEAQWVSRYLELFDQLLLSTRA